MHQKIELATDRLTRAKDLFKRAKVRAQTNHLFVYGNLIGVNGTLGEKSRFIGGDLTILQRFANAFCKSLAVGGNVRLGERLDAIDRALDVLHFGTQISGKSLALALANRKEGVNRLCKNGLYSFPIALNVLFGLFDLEDIVIARNRHNGNIIAQVVFVAQGIESREIPLEISLVGSDLYAARIHNLHRDPNVYLSARNAAAHQVGLDALLEISVGAADLGGTIQKAAVDRLYLNRNIQALYRLAAAAESCHTADHTKTPFKKSLYIIILPHFKIKVNPF